MMNLSQIDGGGGTTTVRGDNTQFHMMFDSNKHANSNRYTLFKEGGVNAGLLLGQGGGTTSAAEGADGLMVERRCDGNLFPTAHIG